MFIKLRNEILISILLISANQTVGQVNKPVDNAPATTPNTIRTIPAAYAPGVTVNYIRVRDGVKPITDELIFKSTSATVMDVRDNLQYFDGLGRPLQTVSKGFSPNAPNKDVVTPYEYDNDGRQVFQYLPYSASSSDGGFKLNAFADQDLFNKAQFPGEQVFYNKTIYEHSPLNRVLKSFAPGNSWAGSEGSANEKSIRYEYLINNPNDLVQIWIIGFSALTFVNEDVATNIPFSVGSYAAGKLFKNVTMDESGNAVVEFKNKEEQVILRKVQVGDIASDYSGFGGFLCTYYVYDDLNQLRFVIPPKAVETLKSNWTLTVDVINELCFRYEFDATQRMIGKKVPGASWQYMIYDNRDRLVFVQDGNLRSNNQWMATLYDEINRPLVTGAITYSGNQNALQQYVTTIPNSKTGIALFNPNPTKLYINKRELYRPLYQAQQEISFNEEFESETGANFTAEIVTTSSSMGTIDIAGNPLPNSTLIPLILTYYDNYNWTEKRFNNSYSGAFGLNNSSPANDATLDPVATSASNRTKGMITGTRVRVIEDPAELSTGVFLSNVNFYDDKGRVIQNQAENYKGGSDINAMRYDFRNNVISTYLVHNNPAAGSNGMEQIKTDNYYDHAGRLMTTEHIVNGRGVFYFSTYDELGRLNKKEIGQYHQGDTYGNGPMEILNYEYNIRGWLTGINRNYINGADPHHFFGMELSYNVGFDQNQYNGNIAGMKWRSKGDGEQRAYGYGYDKVNRLLYADFNQKFGSDWAKSGTSNTNYQIDFTVKMGDGRNASTAYDANGNIKAMKQWGLKLNSSSLIDDLVYNYASGGSSNTNKLLNVTDAANNPNTTLGDFRTSVLHPQQAKDVNTIDYAYDANGNLKKDLNKDIGYSGSDGIQYNHLNLPYKIMVNQSSGPKGLITYIYDAGGNKLEKRVKDYTNPSASDKTTTYIGSFVYENDMLQFFSHPEGRVRVVKSVANNQQVKQYYYDYFLKDHLGNVRAVVTEEQQQDIYPIASVENASSVNLENNYYRVNAGNVVDKSSAMAIPAYLNSNNIPGNNIYINEGANSGKLYRLNGSTNADKMGLGITLKVMAGDNVNIFGKSYWKTAAGSGVPGQPQSIVVLNLLNDFVGRNLPGGKAGITGAGLNDLSDVVLGINGLLGGQQQTSAKPKAYINWILFDENFRPVISNANTNSGFDQVGAEGELKSHIKSTGEITKSGYLYIYCSNESQLDVFFDNLQVVHNRGALLEETHYYPFGLTMAGISSKAINFGNPENKRKFNKGSDLQNKEFSDGSGLELYATNFRILDPQLGRWCQIDPKPDYAQSLYSAMNNNPILINDPLGDTAWPIKHRWNERYERQFRRELNNILKALNKSDQKFTCDDLALQTIVSFSSKNNLPFKWTTGSGTFNATDDKYTNTKDFLLDVKKHSGAADFANNTNTTKIDLQNVKPGSLNVLTSEGNTNPNHIQVISAVFNDGKQSVVELNKMGVTGFIAAQGNFNGLGRVLGSDNPTSFRYLGVPIQAGVYDGKSNTWTSSQTGTTTNFIGGHYSNEYRDFNFSNFNQ